MIGGAGGNRAMSSCPVGGAGYFPRAAKARSGSSGMSTSTSKDEDNDGGENVVKY